ncbi:hypothetical protein SFUMM280S_06213 [Streptomyces fumanus]
MLLDNVGGVQLTAAVDPPGPGARLALVGALSGQFDPAGTGNTAPARIDSFRLLFQGASLLGYTSLTTPTWRRSGPERFGAWLRSGEIQLPLTRVTGIERAPRGNCQGRTFGSGRRRPALTRPDDGRAGDGHGGDVHALAATRAIAAIGATPRALRLRAAWPLCRPRTRSGQRDYPPRPSPLHGIRTFCLGQRPGRPTGAPVSAGRRRRARGGNSGAPAADR